MISLYTGSVGSGKSYHALEVGFQVLAEKRHVIANFPIKPPEKYRFRWQAMKWQQKLDRWFYADITVEYLMAKSIEMGWFGKESQCMVIIDEAGVLFNSRDWQSDRGARGKWIKFLSQSRKFGYDFVFVCQSDRMIDKQIRGLVEYEVKHLKANNSFFLRWLSIFNVTLFLYVYSWYHVRLRANLRTAFFRKSLADRYDTFRVFNTDDLIKDLKGVYEGKEIPINVQDKIDEWTSEKEKAKQLHDQIEEDIQIDKIEDEKSIFG